MPTLELFEQMAMFQEAWDPYRFHLWLSAFWKTYHEFTM